MTTPPPQPREAEVMSSTQHTANAAHASREPCRSRLALEPARTASRRLEAREKGEWT